jgi:hypothetical protein
MPRTSYLSNVRARLATKRVISGQIGFFTEHSYKCLRSSALSVAERENALEREGNAN